MRQVRRFENRRDDPLWDEALAALSRLPQIVPARKDAPPMSAPIRPAQIVMEEAALAAEARRILRRLVEPGAVLAIAPDMDRAAVLKSLPDGRSVRTAVVERCVAQAFALRDWISCRKPGRIATYEITGAGRATLRRMMQEDAAPGLAEAATPLATSIASGAAAWSMRPKARAACATIWPKARWRCWGGAATRMGNPS